MLWFKVCAICTLQNAILYFSVALRGHANYQPSTYAVSIVLDDWIDRSICYLYWVHLTGVTFHPRPAQPRSDNCCHLHITYYHRRTSVGRHLPGCGSIAKHSGMRLQVNQRRLQCLMQRQSLSITIKVVHTMMIIMMVMIDCLSSLTYFMFPLLINIVICVWGIALCDWQVNAQVLDSLSFGLFHSGLCLCNLRGMCLIAGYYCWMVGWKSLRIGRSFIVDSASQRTTRHHE